MKRKIKVFLVICCLAIALTLCLTACGNKCEHVYDNACDITCNECNEERTITHTWKNADCTTPKTCTVCGATDGSALGHTPADDDGDCTTPITCSVCGTTTTPAKDNHTGGTATCTEKAKCTACGTAYGTIDANNHIDENTDHICDRECGKTDIGIHADSNEDNDHVCDHGCGATLENHAGGTATCSQGKLCDICGFEYDTTRNPNNHASDEFTYTSNTDGTTHTKKYKCCDAVADEAEAHNGTVSYTPNANDSTKHDVSYSCCDGSYSVTHTMNSATGKCVCGLDMADASVTTAGDTPVVTYYATLAEAITAAQSATGSTVQLLDSVTLSDTIYITTGQFTIDLNGKTVTSASDYDAFSIYTYAPTVEGTNVTIISTVSGGKIESSDKLSVSVGDDATARVIGVELNAVYASGTLTLENVKITASREGITAGGTGTGNVTILGNSSISADICDVVCGTYATITLGEGVTFPDGLTAVSVSGYKALNTMLADGMAYWQGDNKMIQLTSDTYEIAGGTVTVKAVCTHEGGTQTYAPIEGGTQHTATYSCCGATVTEAHSGGTATCLVGKICEICGFEYEATNPNNHASDELTYTANEDGTTHTGTYTYNCCGAEVKIETVIEGSTATITISEMPTLLMVRIAIENLSMDIKSININGTLNETLQGYVATALSGRTVDLYLPDMETSELSESLTSEEDNIDVHCGYIVENGTYLVYNAEGLYAWGEAARAVISTGTEDTDNDWYAEYTTDMPNLILAADITLTGANNWTPLGYRVEGNSKDTYYPYIGTIDGNGHTITGLNINSTGDCIAFVGSLGPNSEVKNLTFKDATIVGGEHVATVAADCGGNVTNCHVTGSSSVSGNIQAAGVIASNGGGIISGCTNAAAVTVNVNDVNWGSGGVVGINGSNGIVIGCFNSGDITASGSSNTQNCGGVVGLNNHNASIIIACGNTGKVEASVKGVGGIAGGNSSVPVYACWTKETTELSNGEVSNKDGVGVDNNNKSVLKACYSFADASAVADAITAMNAAIDEYNASAAEGRKCTYKWQVGTDGYPTLVEID